MSDTQNQSVPLPVPISLENLSLQDSSSQENTLGASEPPAAADSAGASESPPVAASADGEAGKASANAESPADDEPIDKAIRDALSNPKTRIYVLRYEEDVLSFLQTEDRPDLRFPLNLTSYQRLLAHRVSQYYGLETSTIESGDDQGKVVAVRTPATKQPPIKLAEWKVPEGELQAAQLKSEPMKVMVRRRNSDRHSRSGGDESSGSGNMDTRPLHEREQEYNRARARIFGQRAPPDQQRYSKQRPPSGGSYSEGPRGRPNGDGSNDMGKKAVFRNREEELNDPDYRRNYSRFGPRFDPGFGDDGQHGLYVQRTYSSEFPALAPGMQPQQGMYHPDPQSYAAMQAMHHQHQQSHQQGAAGLPSSMGQDKPTWPGGAPYGHVAMQPYPLTPGAVPQFAPGMVPQFANMGAFYPPHMAFSGMPMGPQPYGFMAPRPGPDGAYPAVPMYGMPMYAPGQMAMPPPGAGGNKRSNGSTPPSKRNGQHSRGSSNVSDKHPGGTADQ